MRGNQPADFDEADWVPEAETPPSSRSGCFKLDFDVSQHSESLWCAAALVASNLNGHPSCSCTYI